MDADKNSTRGQDEAQLAEIAYHQRQNRIVIYAATPSLLLYAGFYYTLGSYFQTLLIVLMLMSSWVGIWIGYRLIKTLHSAILHKRINAGIWFGLLATNLLTGIWDRNIYYVVLPWMIMYPLAAVMFLGRKLGFLTGTAFSLVALIFFFIIDMPPLDQRNVKFFQFSFAGSLLSILVISIIYEKIRVKVQDDLAVSQQEYRLAEQRQRETNVELEKEIERRKLSEKALKESELHYRALFEESSVALWEEDWSLVKTYLDTLIKDEAGDLLSYFRERPQAVLRVAALIKTTAANRAALTLFELDRGALVPVNLFWLMKDFQTDFLIDQMQSLHSTGRHRAEVTGRTQSGREIHLMITSALPAGYENTWEKVFTSIYDLTERIAVEEERKRMAEQMQHARQIQAIATLAGGIAHQFNNALAVIYGSLDLLEMSVTNQPENRRFISTLKTSANRMSRLTDQLLAYAEGGKYQPQNFSVNDLVLELVNSKMMVRDSTIQVVTDLCHDAPLTTGDITQIKMVIEVVLSNAFEALPQGGVVKISTGRRRLEGCVQKSRQVAKPGDYTFICIEDNGAGMKEETLERIFEPFFTTKIYGRGLGMAAAFGIIRNHDGIITVDSELGVGTKVVIYLPCAEGQEDSFDSPQTQLRL
jgi:signal transduction histidine kinase